MKANQGSKKQEQGWAAEQKPQASEEVRQQSCCVCGKNGHTYGLVATDKIVYSRKCDDDYHWKRSQSWMVS